MESERQPALWSLQALDQYQHVAFVNPLVFEFVHTFANQKHTQSSNGFVFQRNRGVDFRCCERIEGTRIILYFHPQIGASQRKADLDGPSLTRPVAVRNDVGQVFLQCDM